MEAEELSFEPARAEDAETVFTMAADLIRTYEDPDLVPICRVLAWTEEKIRENIGDYVCICRNGEKTGYFRLSREKNSLELDDFYILPQYRSQGIGTAALKKCLSGVVEPVFLYVFKENTGALKLYRQMGFRVWEDVSPTRMILRREG